MCYNVCYFLFFLKGTGQRKKDTVYIVDIISVSDEFFGDKPQKERLHSVPHLLSDFRISPQTSNC